MNAPERWQEVKEILNAALELDAEARASFLDERCGGDPELLRELESLIDAHGKAERLESPAIEVIAAGLPREPGDGVTGKKLGHYKVIEKLGAGGMGEVYLAEDSSLGRKVALKLLPPFFTRDQERVRRFQQEARAVSALNHPNILTIYEIREINSTHYIATEFIDGETLRDRLGRGNLTVRDAVDIAVQVAAALAAAHDAGIIHRDVKPENIMLRRDGIVKVLDFGLAKLTEKHTPDREASTMIHTDEGLVMGTAQYMSPEQARGLRVDARTDIWSLGCVLYEMFAGQAPFTGPTPSDVIVSVLEREPAPLARLRPELPPELDWLVQKTLRKDADERYQTSKELLSDLRALERRFGAAAQVNGEPITGPGPSETVRTNEQSELRVTEEQPGHQSTSSAEYIVTEIGRRKWAALGVVALLALGAATIVWNLVPARGDERRPALPPANFVQLTDQAGPEYFPSLAPDGKSLVYARFSGGSWDIYLQRVGGRNPINLTQDSLVDDTQPAFSPDSESIAFRSEREGGGIFVMGATGESVKRVSDLGFNPAWSPDSKQIVFAGESIVTNPAMRWRANNSVWVADVATGEKRLVANEGTQPSWSPNGHRIALCGKLGPGGRRDIHTIPAGGGEPVPATSDAAMDWSPVWSPDGKYIYFASNRGGSMNIWRLPVEEATGKILGEPEAVTTPSPFSGHLSFSADGKRLAYAQMISKSNLHRVEFDPRKEAAAGPSVPVTQGSLWTNTPHLSPDGEWLAFDSQGTQGSHQEDLFIVRRDGTSLRKLTDDEPRDRKPYWSPDGKRIVFFSNRSGKWEIWVINADGSGLQQLTEAPDEVTNAVWSPDGARLAFRNYSKPPSIMEVSKPWREQSPEDFPEADGLYNWFPWSWSPNGARVAGFAVGPSGPDGVSVYSPATRQFQKLTNFGLRPVWLSDSRRLLFQDLQGKLYLLHTDTGKVSEVFSAAPQELGNGVTTSRDDRQIYLSLVTTEADIWLMTME